MLQTIEVEIDTKGHIHPLEKMPLKAKSRALLTISSGSSGGAKANWYCWSGNARIRYPATSRSVSIEEMEAAIHTRGSRFDKKLSRLKGAATP